MEYLERGHPGFGRAIAALFAGGLVTFAILYSTQPLLPEFSRDFGVSPATASLSVSLTTAVLAIAMLVTSSLSESHGRKRLMACSLTLSAILAVLTAITPNFALLLSLRAIQGAVLAGLPAIAMAYIGEEFHPSHLGTVMGLYISGNSLGGMSGPGVLTEAFSWHIALAAIGIFSLALAVSFWFLLPESRHFAPKPQRLRFQLAELAIPLRRLDLLALYGVAFTLMGSFAALYNYVGYLLTGAPYHLSQAAVGWLFLVYLTGTVSSTVFGRMADKYGWPRVLGTGISLMWIGAILTLLAPLALKICAIALFTFGFFGSHSAASSWVGRKAQAQRAQASALYLLFYYAGSSVMGWIGGFFWSHAKWPGVIGLISVQLIGALACTASVSRADGHVDARRPS
jgi:YNFM family putative membrane transporter